ncbi:MAG: tetratricopeptide repeat protein [bacterium]|nr:tetratricopeptide repeat protein [bacterium]
MFEEYDDDRLLEEKEQLLEELEKQGDKEALSHLNDRIGIIYEERGEYEQALRYYNESHRELKELGNKHLLSGNLHQMGMVYQRKGDYEQALTLYQRSLEIDEELEDKNGISTSCHNIGMVHQNKGDYEQALSYYQRSLEIDEELEDQSGISSSLHQIGMLHQVKGEYEQALALYQRSLKIEEELDDKYGIANSKGQISSIKLELEKYAESLEYSLAAFCLYKELEAREIETVRKGILIAKDHMDRKEFNESLNRAGIDPEELIREEEDDDDFNPTQMLTIMAMEDGEQATEMITGLINGMSKETKETKDGQTAFSYLQFLLELAAAEDKDAFLENTDPKMLKVVKKILGEETNPLELIAALALEEGEQAAELITELVSGMSKETKESPEGKEFLARSQFLKELAEAEDKDGFLRTADPEMVEFLKMALE